MDDPVTSWLAKGNIYHNFVRVSRERLNRLIDVALDDRLPLHVRRSAVDQLSADEVRQSLISLLDHEANKP